MRLALTLAATLALGLGGCEEHGHDNDNDGGPTTTIKAKYGGQVVALAKDGPAMEIVYDETAGTIKLYAYTAAGKPQKLDEAPVVNLVEGPTQVDGIGADDKWTFTHKNLKMHPHARFRLTIGGVTYNNDSWHPEGDDH